MHSRLGTTLMVAGLTFGLVGCPSPRTGSKAIPIKSPTPSPVAPPAPAPAITTHQGVIGQNETWTKAQNPHLIRGVVSVENGATLTLEPGAIVRLESGACLVIGSTSGTLQAAGTPEEPITFTSAAPSPSPGDWGELHLANGSIGSVLRHCRILYGGNPTNGSTLHLSGAAKPTVEHVLIEQSGGYGLYLEHEASFLSFQNNRIEHCGSQAIRLKASAVGALGTGNSFAGNQPNAIAVVGGVLEQSATWRNQGIPYQILEYNLCVEGSNNPLLTLEAGSRLEFAPNLYFYVGYQATGSLAAVGTESNPVVLTGVTQQAGAWNGLNLSPSASNSQLDWVTIEYGGSASENDEANLRIDGSNPTLGHLSIRHSRNWGIRVTGTGIPALSAFGNVRYEGNPTGKDLAYPEN